MCDRVYLFSLTFLWVGRRSRNKTISYKKVMHVVLLWTKQLCVLHVKLSILRKNTRRADKREKIWKE